MRYGFGELVQNFELERVGGAPNGYPLAPLPLPVQVFCVRTVGQLLTMATWPEAVCSKAIQRKPDTRKVVSCLHTLESGRAYARNVPTIYLAERAVWFCGLVAGLIRNYAFV